MTDTKPGGLASKDASEEARREAARLMGAARTPAKLEASMRNLARRGPDQLGGRPAVPLFEIPCRCGAGDVVEGHKAVCPRGAAVKRRKVAGKDPMTGAPFAEAQP